MVQEDGGRIGKIFVIPLAHPLEKMGIQDDGVWEVDSDEKPHIQTEAANFHSGTTHFYHLYYPHKKTRTFIWKAKRGTFAS